jgi:hypothetical protein
MLRWLNDAQPAPGLTAEQRRRARAAVLGMWSRRQQRVAARRGRRLWKLISRR